jgi:hypothetical protein
MKMEPQTHDFVDLLVASCLLSPCLRSSCLAQERQATRRRKAAGLSRPRPQSTESRGDDIDWRLIENSFAEADPSVHAQLESRRDDTNCSAARKCREKKDRMFDTLVEPLPRPAAGAGRLFSSFTLPPCLLSHCLLFTGEEKANRDNSTFKNRCNPESPKEIPFSNRDKNSMFGSPDLRPHGTEKIASSDRLMSLDFAKVVGHSHWLSFAGNFPGEAQETGARLSASSSLLS